MLTFSATIDLAKYPFTQRAVRYISSLGLELKDLDSDIGEKIVKRAVERIIQAIKKRIVYTDLRDCDIEVLSYPVTFIILSLINDPMLARIYAVAEAKRVSSLLESEPLNKVLQIIVSTNNKWDIRQILINNSLKLGIHFTDYLENLPEYSSKWKLSNRVIHNGYVIVTKHELIRLFEESLKEMLLSKISKNKINDDIPKNVRKGIEQVLEEWKPLKEKYSFSLKASQVSAEKYPPCIRHILEQAKRGENLSHAARFALATFMLSIGKSIEEVVKIFSTMPDFNESMTRYQVEHLAGLRGSRKKYSPFNCKNMKALNLCYPEEEICRYISHPLQYVIRVRRRKTYARGKISTKSV